ncbi:MULTISPECIES: Cof-type HAD-IIB family hydrolase [unclassified Sporolactobacillus]|uniref:Cof-type HAD-IIB family hydrolase n=1 Tax=unclassified Sporolactobacillus TaxID=2628533 RepID=UPI00236869D2|nr:Cof-type HAD-IIB family hydrolase [Sporolactobacillus sp. CQH2019]MDD9149057.1 Cof-type HAD-IIB family hydrolase [Sporolactobacillus sp. CQH2019]
MIKMVVTDIDGTFLNDQHDYEIERFNRQLEKMSAFGIHFVVASGNGYTHLLDVFDRKSDVTTFISENGALIVDNGRAIVEKTIPDQTIKLLLKKVLSDPHLTKSSVHLSGRDGTYVQKEDPFIDNEKVQYFLKNVQAVPDLAAVHDSIYKVNLDCQDEDVSDKVEYINRLFDHQLHATQSGWGSIDIIPGGVNKAWALQRLEDYWKITPDEIVAFGDNFNDLEMLQHVGLGYLMRNADASIHDYHLPVTDKDNNHSGVLDMIDRILDRPIMSWQHQD